MRRPAVAWAGLAVTFALLSLGAALTIAGDGDRFEVLAGFIIGIPFAAVGAVVAARQPLNSIGWLLGGVALSWALAAACDGVVQYGLAHPGAVSGIGYFALVADVVFKFFFVFLMLLLVLLPTGRVHSHGSRLVMAGIVLLFAISVPMAGRPGPFDDWEQIRNPLGLEALASLYGVLDQVSTTFAVVLLLISLASVIVRFRRSTGVERAQLRWIVTAVAATGITWMFMIVGSVLPVGDVLWALALCSVAFIPIGIGIAVLRYRLYEIDRVISRTVVYAAVTAVLAGAYVGLVLLGQAVFSSFAGGSNLAIAVSTLVVAALFLPVRSRIQRLVDQRFYRKRYDAQRTLEAFGTRLREQIDLEALDRDLRGVVGDTMQPAHTSLWLRGRPS